MVLEILGWVAVWKVYDNKDWIISDSVRFLRFIGIIAEPRFTRELAVDVFMAVVQADGGILGDSVKVWDYPGHYRMAANGRGGGHTMRLDAFTGRVIEARGYTWRKSGYKRHPRD